MKNELFNKVLRHESLKEVPLLYIIKVFSAIQEIHEKERAEEELMERG